jgi:hypothetical protein
MQEINHVANKCKSICTDRLMASTSIPGCNKVKYEAPTSPLKAGVWFWNKDEGVSPEYEYKFAWGNFKDTATSKASLKDAIYEDYTKNNYKALKEQADKRIEAIKNLNKSTFQENSKGEDVYFDLSYVYSDDTTLLYSLDQLQTEKQKPNYSNQEVVYFDSLNDPTYKEGTIQQDGKTLKMTSGETKQITQDDYKNLHLKSAFDFVGYYLGQLADNNIGADFLFSGDLASGFVERNTEIAMRFGARYNEYAKKNGLSKYSYFNIDSEPGTNSELQEKYLSVNDTITGLFGKKSPFEWDIAGYVNQQQMNTPAEKPFAAEVAEDAQSMIFGSYRATPAAQCGQYDILCNPTNLGYGQNNIWTIAWEGSKTPHEANPSSPMYDETTVKGVREMADIALAQAAACQYPLTIDGNPQVSFSSFLPLYMQLVGTSSL